MVKYNYWKSYTPLVLPVFVELGIEQYHLLYKNWQYGVGPINIFGSNERVKALNGNKLKKGDQVGVWHHVKRILVWNLKSL